MGDEFVKLRNYRNDFRVSRDMTFNFLTLLFGRPDETWLGMSDFRRRKWRPYRSTNSVAMLTLNPRIPMIVALDSKGEVFLSLLQSNSNSENMLLFFSELIRNLDNLRPGWRKDHVLLLDNASYHRSNKILKFFEDHKLPIMYTGSYSYDAGK